MSVATRLFRRYANGATPRPDENKGDLIVFAPGGASDRPQTSCAAGSCGSRGSARVEDGNLTLQTAPTINNGANGVAVVRGED